MIHIANPNPVVCSLLLEVALQAKRLIPLRQQLSIHRSMRGVAGDATFTHSLVFKNKRAPLFGMALETGIVLAHFIHRAAPLDHRSLVRIVAVSATDLAFQHRVMMRKVEFGSNLKVTLEAGLRRFSRIYNRVGRSPAGNMLTARSVAGFATGILRILAVGHQARMVCRLEVTDDFLVTVGTGFGSHEGSPGNRRRHHDGSGYGAA